MIQKMIPPEADFLKLFQPIYSQGCSLAIANRIWDPKNFLAPSGARGFPLHPPKVIRIIFKSYTYNFQKLYI